ncbi:MAG: histidine phosphatase family protein [Myxococcales bacterium]|nr:histidine phosphatase family protein [Myxococcales bacterium]USN50094.1 MAG: histidine phosphatase family protein [Myxococcales bacterium]
MKYPILKLLAGFLLFSSSLTFVRAHTVEIIAVRHGESLNNVLSQKKAPISFFISMFEQGDARARTETTFHNPVLSTEGRKQAIELNTILFPNNSDPGNIVSSPGKNTVLFVSPLNRTIQTALLVFGSIPFSAGVRMLANPLITEHRKSVSEDGFIDAARPINLFDLEIEKLEKNNHLSRSDKNSIQFHNWAHTFKESLKDCCDGKQWWPKGPVESEEDVGNRISLFKNELEKLPPNSRVLLVSHGTFLRALFFGLPEMKNKNYHIRNVGMLTGTFDTNTKEFVKDSIACFDPNKKMVASGLDPNAICFDKLARNESIVVDKGPVYEIDKSPPLLSQWQTRQLNIFKQDGLVGITWAEEGSTSVAKIKGAAQIVGATENCSIPSKWTKDRETLCLIIQRVKLDPKYGPLWEKIEEGTKWEILRLSWKNTNSDASKLLNGLFKN